MGGDGFARAALDLGDCWGSGRARETEIGMETKGPGRVLWSCQLVPVAVQRVNTDIQRVLLDRRGLALGPVAAEAGPPGASPPAAGDGRARLIACVALVPCGNNAGPVLALYGVLVARWGADTARRPVHM